MPSKFSRLFHFQFFLNINPALVEVLIEVFGLILDYVMRVMIISPVIAFYNCSCVLPREISQSGKHFYFNKSRNGYFKGFLFPLGSVLVAGMCKKSNYREFRSNICHRARTIPCQQHRLLHVLNRIRFVGWI